MTVFIYEHLTSGALAGETLSPSLMKEGDAMLTAICRDLTALGCQLTIMRDSRLPPCKATDASLSVLSVDSQQRYRQIWQQSLDQHQQFIVIAPETDGLLEKLVRQLEERDKVHFGCRASIIALCTDKLECSRWLTQQGVVTPESVKASDWSYQARPKASDWIIKPRDGAGCEQTFRMTTNEIRSYLNSLSTAELDKQIVQPFIAGMALSLSLFVTETDITVLSVNRQHINQSNHALKLNHCEAGREDLIEPAAVRQLTQQIHATMPGLWGFVGVDLVKTADALWLIEINPRLTASYAELSLIQTANPAQQLMPYLKED